MQTIDFSPHMKRNVTSIFFAAMQEGYVAKPEKTHLSELPGSKHIVYKKDEWQVTDTYIVSAHGSQSGGTTIVAFAGEPVWMMQYLGQYRGDAIPFLKEALDANYQHKRWHGGRGPEVYTNEAGWQYSNRVMEFSTFTHFSGEERVFDPEGMLAGWHTYQGIWMLRQDIFWPYP